MDDGRILGRFDEGAVTPGTNLQVGPGLPPSRGHFFFAPEKNSFGRGRDRIGTICLKLLRFVKGPLVARIPGVPIARHPSLRNHSGK